ncbi:DUF192 domain-containing protein [Puniceicoccales bacterium CK1056]|uniref:DUF192 domain-containing protein n=1 Tax=Oceanipulchritudo coccoides TaxID=2706888 RepID=A0A6B2M0Y2_9BACT|nr:DUF192 domain-containing protein [Oceanipulchritudo coccoides]NDV62568.1 DUF192 domain-containing protein [Oceanipulchritudo coccoides]
MRKLFCLILPMFFLFAGCQKEADTSVDPLGPEAWIALKVGDVTLEAQIVLTQAEQRKGLMYRDSLGENRGMLFPYDSPRQLAFWMANTRIPLDIGFFDETGLLCEVHRMVPFDTTRTVSRGKDLQYALEMNSGWFARNGLFPGVRMDMELLAEALRSRGKEPAEPGITRQ